MQKLTERSKKPTSSSNVVLNDDVDSVIFRNIPAHSGSLKMPNVSRTLQGRITTGGLQRGSGRSMTKTVKVSKTIVASNVVRELSSHGINTTIESLDDRKPEVDVDDVEKIDDDHSEIVESITEKEKQDLMGNWLTNRTSISLIRRQASVDDIDQSQSNELGDINIGDLDSSEESISGLMISPDTSHVWLSLPVGTPLDSNTAVDLKMLVLGSLKKNFPEEWKIQTFTLNKNAAVNYGLVQQKGGPCGVLACVQAYLLKELLFNSKGRRPSASSSTSGGYSYEEISRCLALAFADILWKAGCQKAAIIAFPSNRNSFTDDRPGLCDGFIEKLNLIKFTDLTALQSFLIRHIGWYIGESGRGTCIAFLYTVVLSRGIKNVKLDMDEDSNCLIGAHGYCSQEVINLFLTGNASSNVFDNVVVLDEGTESQSSFKGVTRRSDFGFLALFEHYNSCQVGNNFKRPRYPIWVVCSESHYSVLFAKQRSVVGFAKDHQNNSSNELKKFDLYFYDCLLQQDDEIRLTIDLTGEQLLSTKCNKEVVVPPLELCIRTKWKDAVVHWNGTEPLL